MVTNILLQIECGEKQENQYQTQDVLVQILIVIGFYLHF
jgi:hypothetical protein